MVGYLLGLFDTPKIAFIQPVKESEVKDRLGDKLNQTKIDKKKDKRMEMEYSALFRLNSESEVMKYKSWFQEHMGTEAKMTKVDFEFVKKLKTPTLEIKNHFGELVQKF